MKKISILLCTLFSFFIITNFIGCKKIECQHTYSISKLFTDEELNTEQTKELNISKLEKPCVFCCSKCNQMKYGSASFDTIGLPTIDFSGSLNGISKENELEISVSYKSEDIKFDCDAKIKVQGNSSAGYDKKNYTIKLYEEDTDFDKKYKVELVDGWGKENKYCLKANYVDFSQSRNIVSAKLYGQIVKSRNNDSKLENLYNGGAIDGYPVVIYHNGSFLGLYTMNIPKDKWLLNMDDYDPEKDSNVRKEAILMGDGWSESVSLKEPINPDFVSSKWELEFCSTEEDNIGTSWVYESFNEFIAFLNESDEATFKSELKNYIDVQSAIDCYLYTNIIFAEDNIGKNMMYITYDGGNTWHLNMYDMDGTWGLMWNGSMYEETYSTETILSYNELYRKLELYFADEITERYSELRENILTLTNIEETFSSFFDSIPSFVRDAEKTRWSEIPSQETNNFEQILKFAKLRLDYLDEIFS